MTFGLQNDKTRLQEIVKLQTHAIESLKYESAAIRNDAVLIGSENGIVVEPINHVVSAISIEEMRFEPSNPQNQPTQNQTATQHQTSTQNNTASQSHTATQNHTATQPSQTQESPDLHVQEVEDENMQSESPVGITEQPSKPALQTEDVSYRIIKPLDIDNDSRVATASSLSTKLAKPQALLSPLICRSTIVTIFMSFLNMPYCYHFQYGFCYLTIIWLMRSVDAQLSQNFHLKEERLRTFKYDCQVWLHFFFPARWLHCPTQLFASFFPGFVSHFCSTFDTNYRS